MSSTALRRLIVIALIVLWEALPRIGAVPELFLPSLSSTLQAGWSDAGEYGHALMVTLYEVAVAMVFACGGGILGGAVVGSPARSNSVFIRCTSATVMKPRRCDKRAASRFPGHQATARAGYLRSGVIGQLAQSVRHQRERLLQSHRGPTRARSSRCARLDDQSRVRQDRRAPCIAEEHQGH